MAKYMKYQVDYSPGSRREHCAICTYFEQPQACEKVKGDIDPAYWCDLFELDKAATDD